MNAPRWVALATILVVVISLMWLTKGTRPFLRALRGLALVLLGVAAVMTFASLVVALIGMLVTGLWPWDPVFWADF